MKPLILWTLGLLAVGTAARGQELRGGYRLEIPKGRARLGGSACWFGNGRFKQAVGGCTGSQEDAGSFTRTGNLLTLRYDKWEQPSSTFTSLPLPADSTRVVLEVIVLDAQTNEHLDGIEVNLPGSRNVRHLTHEAGHALIERTELSVTPDTIVVRDCFDRDYVPLRIPASQVLGQRLTVRLAPKIQRQASGFVETFRIQSLTPKTLVLQFTDPTLAAYRIRYSRLSAAETRLLFGPTN